MSKVSDQTADKLERMAEKSIPKAGQTVRSTAGAAVKGAGLASKTTIKGIVLIISGANFTRREIMDAFKSVALMKTKDIKFSKRNVKINELQKKGSVKNIDEEVKKEVMYYFDKNCKKYGIEYNALKDAEKENTYMIFFSGRSESLIHQAIRGAYVDYTKAEEKKEHHQEQRESVRAKLEFFRNRITANEAVDVSKEADLNKTIKPPERNLGLEK